MNTQSFALQWLPTTGEVRPVPGTIRRLRLPLRRWRPRRRDWSHSLEDKQSQPNTNGIENSQIRLTDGSIVFTPDLFGKGTRSTTWTLQDDERRRRPNIRACRSRANTWRTLTNFTGANTGASPTSTTPATSCSRRRWRSKNLLQLYLSGSQIFGDYGDPSEVRTGAS